MSQYLCKHCCYIGKPKSFTPGSTDIEFLLWLCFIIPGIIYGCWRVSARYKGCPQCRTPRMIPVDSPAARLILHNMNINHKAVNNAG